MNNALTLQHFKQIRHFDEIIEIAHNSWWVYRRSIKANGSLSINPRVVFFGSSKEAAARWLEQQAAPAAY